MKKNDFPRTVVLVGFKASGKSRVGRALARRLGYVFADMDRLIEDCHAAGGRRISVRRIYKSRGKDYFLKLEGAALKKAARLTRTVVSLGGGSPLNPAFSRARFRGAAFVYLRAQKDVLFKRIMKKGRPPFFDPANPRKSFNALLKLRAPVYGKIADVTADNSGGRGPAEVAAGILEKLGRGT